MLKRTEKEIKGRADSGCGMKLDPMLPFENYVVHIVMFCHSNDIEADRAPRS